MPLDKPAPVSEEARAAGAEEEQEKAKKKGLPPIVMYGAIGLVMAVAGYFGGTKFLGSAGNQGEPQVTEAEGNAGDEGEGKDGAGVATEMIEFEDVIVNPAGTGGTRFLAVSIGFEISGSETAGLFENRKPVVRDALISILGSKTIEQLSDAKEKEITRFQIKKRVEHLLKTKNLEAVYFTNFVLQ